MYDKEMVSRAILSPFTSNLNNEIARQEMIDGYQAGVRSIIVCPGQIQDIVRVREQYGNGHTRCGIVVGYPYGGLSTNMKTYLTRQAVENELDEIDLGVNITALKSGDFAAARADIEAVLEAAGGALNVIPLVWVIRLPLEMVDKICQLYVDLGIRSIKTSPGIHFGDMKVEHVRYLYDHFGDKLDIEVAGRCRSREKAEAMQLAGAKYFHISQWRRISGIGQDIQFNWDTKCAAKGEYQDRT